ncbi:MAG: IS200/IS605 family transposase, partial [Pirellulaceae bacterium]
MSEYIHKSHNVSVLLYHLVFPAKYRRAVLDRKVDEVLRDVCLEIEKRYQINFLEIGTDKDYVHFLVQSVPTYSVTKLVTMVKSLTAREIFKRCPYVKEQLWGG